MRLGEIETAQSEMNFRSAVKYGVEFGLAFYGIRCHPPLRGLCEKYPVRRRPRIYLPHVAYLVM